MGTLTAVSGGFAIHFLAALLLHRRHPLHRDSHKNTTNCPLPMQEKEDPGSFSGLEGIRDLMLPQSAAEGAPTPVHLLLHAPKPHLPAAGHQGRSPSIHSTAVPRSGTGRAPAPAPSTVWGEDRDTSLTQSCWLHVSCGHIAQKLEQKRGQVLGSECGGTCLGFKGLIFTWLARVWARSRRRRAGIGGTVLPVFPCVMGSCSWAHAWGQTPTTQVLKGILGSQTFCCCKAG